MIRYRASASLVLVAMFLISMPQAAHADVDVEANGPAIEAQARETAERERAAVGADPATRLIEYARHASCTRSSVDATTELNGPCSNDQGQVALPFCDGLAPVLPAWTRRRDTPSSPWSPWVLAVSWSCPQDQLPTLTLEDFRRLPLAPPPLTIQPDRPEVLVNIATITMAEATTQHFTTDLLGYPIEVEATPSAFVWDYGDGSEPLRTTSPGHPWPDHDVSHDYRAPGTYTITLTTEFSGRYRLVGSTTWLDVTGVATTTTTAPPITAVERESRLVSGPCATADC